MLISSNIYENMKKTKELNKEMIKSEKAIKVKKFVHLLNIYFNRTL